MTYNERLKELFDEAKANGFSYINGEFVDTKADYIKVLSVRSRTIGEGEENGDMGIFDKLYVLSEPDYKKLIKLSKDDKNNALDTITEIIDSYNDPDWNRSDWIDNILSCYDNIYMYDEKESLNSCSVKHECHLSINVNCYETNYMEFQVLNIPKQIFENHKQICIESYPINPGC
jgi:hypothetical protein